MSIEAFRPQPTADAVGRLIEAAMAEYRLSYSAAVNSLHHAILCGEALIQLKAAVPHGTWYKWYLENVQEISYVTGIKFIRLARKRADLEAGNISSIAEAAGYLSSLSLDRMPRGTGHAIQIPPSELTEMRRLRSEGLSCSKIGALYGYGKSTVYRHLDPEWGSKARIKSNRRRSAAKALAQSERDAQVRKRGGSPAEAYAMLRKTALVIDRAISESRDSTETVHLQTALGFTHKAEDLIVRALRVGRTS